MNRIAMPPRAKQIPAKESHFHPRCAHWCFGSTCSAAARVVPCQRCRRDAFNDGLTVEQLLERRA